MSGLIQLQENVLLHIKTNLIICRLITSTIHAVSYVK